MKKFLVSLIISILFGGVPLANAGSYTDNRFFWKPDYRESGPAAYTSYNAALDATDLFLKNLEPLPGLIANWAIEDQIVTMIPVACTYSDNNTFTLPGDYTSRFPANAVVQIQVAAGMVYSTVASSSYTAPTTTVNLNDTVLTNPITRVFVVATRDGLWPNGPGYVVALDYGADRAALVQADGIAAGAGKELRVTYAYTIDADVTLAAPKVTVQPGVPFAIATTKTLTINGSFDAGLYQIFSCTGTGKVVFGPGAVKEVYPQWWGAIGDDATDCTAALQAAFDTGMKVVLPTGTYQHTDLAIKASGFRMEGVEKTKSILKPKATAVKGIYTDNLGTSTFINNITLENFSVDMSLMDNAATSFGIYLRKSFWNILKNIYVDKATQPVSAFALGMGTGVYVTRVSDCTFMTINMQGASGGDRVTTITFVNLDSYYVYMKKCLSMTFLQPVMQGEYPAKFEFEEVANLSVINGDIEGGGIYLKSNGANNVNIYSQGNNFMGQQGNVWKGSRRYMLGAKVFPSTDNTFIYTCTTEGLAGSSEPVWPAGVGGTVNDGTVVWTRGAVTPWADYKSGTFVCSQLLDESNAQGDNRYVRWFDSKFVHDETLNHFAIGGGDPENAGAGVQILGQYLGLDYGYGILGKDSTGAWRYVFTADDSIGRVVIGDPGGTEATLGVLLRSGSARNVGVVPNDLEIYGYGKGVILTNTAGTVSKRVRLNDAGDGLVFEAP